MKGFAIYVKNELLEPKHVKNMGEAVWLYMWLLDKVTSVNENGIGKVLGGRPVVFADINIDLGIHRNTYAAWVTKLRDANYIDTLRTPRGLTIIVKKAEKGRSKPVKKPKVMHTKPYISDAHDSVHHKNSDAHEQGSDAHESVHAEDAHESVHPIKTNQSRLNKTKQYTDGKPTELIAKLYYQVIKKYSLPVRNHNTVKASIAKLARELSTEDAEIYLTFLLDKYQGLNFSHKPELNEALDIYAKRQSIINAVKRAATKRNGGTIKI